MEMNSQSYYPHDPCAYCPFVGRDDLTCPRRPMDHYRVCAWVDPSRPEYRTDGADALIRIAIGRGKVIASQPVDLDRARILESIRACPQRGASLPVSLQPECGCAELYECRVGKGKVPGQVTTADCWRCKSGD